MPCAAFTSLRHTGPQRTSCEFLCSHQVCPHPVRKAHLLASSPTSKTSCTPPDPPSSGFHLPASLWNYLNKPITSSCGNQGTLPSWYHNTCLPQPLLAHSAPGSSSEWLCMMVVSSCPRLGIHVTNSSVSSVQCQTNPPSPMN